VKVARDFFQGFEVGESNAVENAIGYAMHSSRSHDAVIRVYDAAGNLLEAHEHNGDFKVEGWTPSSRKFVTLKTAPGDGTNSAVL
jgi:hypothetical protein